MQKFRFFNFLFSGVKRFVYISAADFGVVNYLLRGYYEGKVFLLLVLLNTGSLFLNHLGDDIMGVIVYYKPWDHGLKNGLVPRLLVLGKPKFDPPAD